MRDRHNVLGMCHPGTIFGFRAYICHYPEVKKGFFYSTNTDNETANYERFNSLLINHLVIEKIPVLKADSQVMDKLSLEGIYHPSPNNMAAFEFIDLLFNFKWIISFDNKFILNSLQSDDVTMFPVNDNLLRANDRTKASYAAFTDEPGNVWTSLIIGMLGFMYIVLVGTLRLVSRKKENSKIILWAHINFLSFSIPILFIASQSFLRFGELTAASLSLAFVTGLLPVTLLFFLLFLY